jgi:hypothetical protein
MLGADNNKLAKGFFKNGERVKKWKHYFSYSGDIKAEYDFTNNSVTQYDKNGLKKGKRIISENKLQPTASIYGKITDKETNEPLSRAQISLYQDGNCGPVYFASPDGIYYMKKILIGIYDIRVWVSPYYYVIKKEIEIKENEDIALDFQFQKRPTSSLYGKITDKETTNPIGGGDIYIYHFQDGYWRYVTSSWVSPDGIYHIKVPVGTCKVEINWHRLYAPVKREVEIKENEDVELDFQLD